MESYRINIAGQSIQIRSDADVTHVEMLAKEFFCPYPVLSVHPKTSSSVRNATILLPYLLSVLACKPGANVVLYRS